MRAILDTISNESIWGVPLDLLAHFWLGLFAYLALTGIGRSHWVALGIVLVLAVAKELTMDLRVWTTYGFYIEPWKDVFVSILGPSLWPALPSARSKRLRDALRPILGYQL